jgi:mono/diheme cytochrome c family protein
MKKSLLAILLVLVLVASVGLILMFSGVYNVGTANHDDALVNWYLDTGTTHSVKYHAKGITPPALTDPGVIQEGSAHYKEMCVSCHGAPGVEPGEIAKGLWPQAPMLRDGVTDWTPAQLFWIVKNGVKFTAMPAWGPTHSDEKIWSLVAFLEKQPQLSPEQYSAMVKSAGEPEEEHEEEEHSVLK